MVTVVSVAEFNCLCKKCCTTLSYTYKDISEHRVNHDYLGDFDIVKGITCPVCSSIVEVDLYGHTQTKR
jgi:hypothetical protein